MAESATDNSSSFTGFNWKVAVGLVALIAVVHGVFGLPCAVSLFLLTVNSLGAMVCIPDEFTQREFQTAGS